MWKSMEKAFWEGIFSYTNQYLHTAEFGVTRNVHTKEAIEN